jgi:hypothetical protein
MSIIRILYILALIVVCLIFAFGMVFGSNQIQWWLTWAPIGMGMAVVLGIIDWFGNAAERKERKSLERERRTDKVCSWCNKPFTWGHSGYRFHCSQKCQHENSASR